MDIQEEIFPTENKIRSYGYDDNTKFWLAVDDTTYRQSVLISSSSITYWEPKSINDLTINHFYDLAKLRYQVILLGSSSTTIKINNALLQPLFENKIGIEIMPIKAACRTYNLLRSDGRSVLAALIF